MTTPQHNKTASASQNREQVCPNCGFRQDNPPEAYCEDCAWPLQAKPAPLVAETPPQGKHNKGESAHNAGPTPTEYGDGWEPLRAKLTIREAQYLNTYTRTGDIAALNALVLGIIQQRTETAAERDSLKEIAADRMVRLFKAEHERDQAREQLKTLLTACKRLIRWVGKGIASDLFKECVAPKQAENDLRFAEAAIAAIESEVYGPSLPDESEQEHDCPICSEHFSVCVCENQESEGK